MFAHFFLEASCITRLHLPLHVFLQSTLNTAKGAVTACSVAHSQWTPLTLQTYTGIGNRINGKAFIDSNYPSL